MACILKIIYKPIQMLANKLNGKLGKCKIVPGVFTPEEYDEVSGDFMGCLGVAVYSLYGVGIQAV